MIVERIVEHSDKYANESIDNVDYVNVTLEVLQNEVATKKGPLMRIGGPDGMRLTRAAFAVILKFSEQVPLFQTIWDEVEMIGMGMDENIKGVAKYKHIANELLQDKQHEFEILCKQWEQAS